MPKFIQYQSDNPLTNTPVIAQNSYTATGTYLGEDNNEYHGEPYVTDPNPNPNPDTNTNTNTDADTNPQTQTDINPWKDTQLAQVDMNTDYRGMYNDASDAGASQNILDRITQLRDEKLERLADEGKIVLEWDGNIATKVDEPHMYNRPAAETYGYQQQATGEQVINAQDARRISDNNLQAMTSGFEPTRYQNLMDSRYNSNSAYLQYHNSWGLGTASTPAHSWGALTTSGPLSSFSSFYDKDNYKTITNPHAKQQQEKAAISRNKASFNQTEVNNRFLYPAKGGTK